MCHRTEGSIYEPPEVEPCEAVYEAEEGIVLSRLGKTSWDAECEEELDKPEVRELALEQVHGTEER